MGGRQFIKSLGALAGSTFIDGSPLLVVSRSGESLYDIFEYNSGRPGKAVAIMGGVHGNELSGPLAIAKLKKEIEQGMLNITSGTLYLILANKKAMQANKRYLDADLNRSFGNTLYGDLSLEKRIGIELGSFFKTYVDVLMDIHDTLDRPGSEPFIFTDNPDLAKVFSEEVRYCITQFKDDVAKQKILDAMQQLNFGGLASEWYMQAIGKRGVCLEAGTFDKPNPEYAYQSIINFLKAEGLIVGDANIYGDKESYARDMYYEYNPGEFVFAKQYDELSSISGGDLIGRKSGEAVYAPYDGKMVFVIQDRDQFCEKRGPYLPETRAPFVSYSFVKKI